ncbi:hypothetical protein, partial [Clostridium sp. HBUAS56010]|uniref:hypothetical protein n=1 Tax=Clostridium sp. HBUAS56010 TaxID=2571127 RepID=UPI001A9C1E89
YLDDGSKIIIRIEDEAGDVMSYVRYMDDGGGKVGKVVEGAGKPLYDIEGNYTGGRASNELDSLAKDPAHTGSNRPIDIEKGIHERTVGLNVEESGKIKGPIVRDPSGKAEFFDANGQAWDVKSFNSNFKPKKGGYTLERV